jgi:OOP family OmpA-OmpF porin
MHRRTLTAAILMTTPIPAFAQAPPPVTGLYVSLGAGYNLLQDIFDHPRLSPQTLPSTRYRFGPGYVGAGSIGWGLGNGLRLELEGAYDYNDVINRVRTALPSQTTGSQGTYGLFGNVFYDIDPTKFGIDETVVQPYVGAGVGVLWTRFAPLSSVSQNGDVFRLGGTGTNFAYQGIVGFGFPIAAVPGLKFTTDYRLIGIQVNSGAVGESFTQAGLSKGTVSLSPAFLHQFTVGFAYAFNHPPAASPMEEPAPQPAQLPSRSYLVFFDWDRADLTDRARQIIDEAAQASTRVQTTRIEVQGNADSSGTAAYNQALSLRRARVVEAELMRRGVPGGEIAIQAFGDTRPLVATAAGVREPQNRRVAIILR